MREINLLQPSKEDFTRFMKDFPNHLGFVDVSTFFAKLT